jgi:hypothetical protein
MQAILINIGHDYQVIIHPYSDHHNIMKAILIILRNDCNRQVLPISKGNRGESNQYTPYKG